MRSVTANTTPEPSTYNPLHYVPRNIIPKNCPWDPAPVLEGVNVAQQEILNALVKEELDPQRARVTERDDETGEFARGSADADLPEMRPIGLRLLARECCQSQESFLFDGTQRADQTANLNHRAGVAT